ncbi:MAG: type II toxin-antitoxin system VapC family toxin [Microbacteriaceae bacterium]
MLDASAALPLLLRDGQPSNELLERFRSGEGAVVPGLFLVEIANVLATAVRRGRHREATVLDQLRRFAALPIAVRSEPVPPDRLVSLAIRRGLTAYDASYLERARSSALALATTDAALAREAAAEGVELVIPLA